MNLSSLLNALAIDAQNAEELRKHSETISHELEVHIPGAFLDAEPPAVKQTFDGLARSNRELDSLETIVTAATLTAEPMNLSSHDKLFTSSEEFYGQSSTLSPRFQALDIYDIVESLEAVASSSASFTQTPRDDPPSSPSTATAISSQLSYPSTSRSRSFNTPTAFRPSDRFGRKPPPKHLRSKSPSSSHSRSPSPNSGHRMVKREHEELKELEKLEKKYDSFHAQVFDARFENLSAESQREVLDNVTAFLKKGLKTIRRYELRAQARGQRRYIRERQESTIDDTSTKRRNNLQGRFKAFFAKIYALYSPLMPVEVDADHLYCSGLEGIDQINHILVLLAIICNTVMGLSVVQCNFLIGIVAILVKLGMSTTGSSGSSSLHCPFSPSQNTILSDMPASLPDALKKFGVEGVFYPHAACPACNFTVKGVEMQDDVYHFPETCPNNIPGKEGATTCGAFLLNYRKDGTAQPIKPYLVGSLTDYVARCLADQDYLDQCVTATDTAFNNIQSGKVSDDVQSVFEAEFIKDFKGPDGRLFVDRGDKVRLAFSIHVDFFNPNGITHRGAHDSIGVISCANLALDSSIRHLPEHVFKAGIIPGPNEPQGDEIDHFVRPVIEQFTAAWSPGFRVSRTAFSEQEVIVEAGILLSVNDLPAARKIAGFQGIRSGFICSVCDLRGTQEVFNTDTTQWKLRDIKDLRHWAYTYKNASTTVERMKIWEEHGVRWSSFWMLDYWDPTRMLVIDSMHCILEGLVQYHCRHVLRLDASSTQLTPDGLKYAYDWPWIPYEHSVISDRCKLSEKHIAYVQKIQKILCISLAGSHSLTLSQVWTRLENNSTKGALQFVAATLSLPSMLDNIPDVISSLYVERQEKAINNSRKRGKQAASQMFPHGQHATQKNHFIALLLSWRLQQPHQSNAYFLPTGTPETLAHIQRVIRDTLVPSWINSVPKNYGERKAGSLKADEWRTLSTLYLPIALIILWGDKDGHRPHPDSDSSILLQALDHTMALFQASSLAIRYTMTHSRAIAFRKCMLAWIRDLRNLYPHTRESAPRPNIHAAVHIFDFLLLFGPVISWWCFPFERLIGALQKMKTNDHIGGPMEVTIMKSWSRTANLRWWLRRPDCPPAVVQLKVLFDKCFIPANAPTETEEFIERKGSHRAYAKIDGVNISGFRTHKGNASILYRPVPNAAPIAGQIQIIENIPGASHIVRIRVRPYEPLPRHLYDPFKQYPHLLATTYSSDLQEMEHTINVDDIIAHAARFDYSHNRSVFVNLSRQ